MITKTRFAPSPTGSPHIGHIRTAIYAWALSQKDKGIFFMRLEDTDQERFVPGTAQILIDALRWVGIQPDEGYMGENVPEKGSFGPYIQSQCRDLYRTTIDGLIAKDAAYYCFCPKESHDDVVDPKLRDIHDRACRNLTQGEVAERLARGDSFVVRHKVPLGREIAFDDMVHGRKTIVTDTLDDTILLKSDGHATYHLAHLCDDHRMQTTHVIRGEEWLPSAPKHVLLFEQMGWQAPKYAHLSLILIIDKETGNKRKFSKRKGDPSFLDIMRMGYLPEGVFNYLALLGWNPGAGETKEIFTKEDFVSLFRLEDCNKAWALYDQTKLDWVNGEHLAKLSIDDLTGRLSTYLAQYEPEFFMKVFSLRSKEFNQKIITELWSRLKRFNEFIPQTGFFYNEPSINPSLLVNEKMKIDSIDTARSSLEHGLDMLESKADFTSLETLKSSLLGAIAERGLKNWQVLWPLRVALSGEPFSPGAFEIANVIGKEETIRRVKRYLETGR